MPQRPVQARDAVAPAAGLRLRRAGDADIAALVPLINAAYDHAEHHVFPGTSRTERDDLSRQIDGLTVAEMDGRLRLPVRPGALRPRDGRIVACVQIDLSRDPAHVGLLAVGVALHGSGIGSTLTAHAEQMAREAGRK